MMLSILENIPKTSIVAFGNIWILKNFVIFVKPGSIVLTWALWRSSSGGSTSDTNPISRACFIYKVCEEVKYITSSAFGLQQSRRSLFAVSLPRILDRWFFMILSRITIHKGKHFWSFGFCVLMACCPKWGLACLVTFQSWQKLLLQVQRLAW